MNELFSATLARADPINFWVGAAFATALGVWLLRWGLKSFWRLRLIVDTPTARIRSAPQGYVELIGLAAAARGSVTAKLSGLPCVWYRWRIEQHKSRGAGSSRSSSWVTIDKGSAERPFLVDDGTGQAEVNPDGAHLHLRTRDQWYGPHPDRRGHSSGNFFSALFEDRRRYRMTEERIAEQEPLYILGRFETPRRGVRERQALTRTLLAQWKRDPQRMRSIDRDGDGEVDLEEWERARQHATRLAERAEARLGTEPPRPRIGATGDPSQPFVIATEEESSLLLRLRLSAFGGTLGGALLAVGTVAAVLARLVA